LTFLSNQANIKRSYNYSVVNKKRHCSYSEMKCLRGKQRRNVPIFMPLWRWVLAQGSRPHRRDAAGMGQALLGHCYMKNTNPSHPAPAGTQSSSQILNKELLCSLQFHGLFPRHITTSTRREERLQSLSLNKSALFPEEILS